jgi:hypothetical protein
MSEMPLLIITSRNVVLDPVQDPFARILYIM